MHVDLRYDEYNFIVLISAILMLEKVSSEYVLLTNIKICDKKQESFLYKKRKKHQVPVFE